MKKQLAQLRQQSAQLKSAVEKPDALTLEQLQFQFNVLVEMQNNTFYIVGLLCDVIEKKLGPLPDEISNNTID